VAASLGSDHRCFTFVELELEIFIWHYIQHNTTDTEHLLIMNARTPVITKIVDATGRPLKLQNISIVIIRMSRNLLVLKKLAHNSLIP